MDDAVEMAYRPLGTSGLMVSVVGLGCNAFGARIDEQQTQAVVEAALDAGITLFDTADSYSLGAANGPAWEARASRRYVRRAVEGSLRRLGTDHIDLYQIHQLDLVTPLEETVEAMNELVDEGKVRYLGCSNLSAWEVVEAHWIATSRGHRPFLSAQNEYSLYNRSAEEELVPALEHLGMGLLPYFPLAYGLLTGKYRRGEAAPEGSRLSTSSQQKRLETADFDRVEALESFAADRDVSILDVALGGLAAQPTVASVIAGATKPEQIVCNVASGLWQPSEDDLAALAGINTDRGTGMRHTTYARR